mgnify:CR=1 FL=1
MRTPRKAKSDADWLDTLPEAFTDYLDGRRLEEVECIIPDLAGTSRGKAMPSYKFRPDETFYLPISLFYQTISGEYVDMEIENQWLEKDVVLTPDMSTATAVPWADDATATAARWPSRRATCCAGCWTSTRRKAGSPSSRRSLNST